MINRKFRVLILIFLTLGMLSQACFCRETYFSFKKTYNVEIKKKINDLNLLVNNSNGNVGIYGWEKPSCRIIIDYNIPAGTEAEARSMVGEKTQIRYENKELIVSTENLFEYFSSKFSIFKKSSPSVKVSVYLPQSMVYDITCDTSNADITAKKIKCSKSNFNTSNGNISFENIKAESVAANTSNGRIVFENALVKNIDADTSNGNISISMPYNESTGVFVKANTSNGKISVDWKNFIILNQKIFDEDPTELKGQSKNFAAAKNKIVISADTSNGAVKIQSR